MKEMCVLGNEMSVARIEISEIGWERMWKKSNYCDVFDGVSRSGSSILNQKVNGEALVRINITDCRWNNGNISSQLPLGMLFPRQPQVTSGCPQSQSEQSDYECLDRNFLSFNESAGTSSDKIAANYRDEEIGRTFFRGLFACLVFAVVYAFLKGL